MGGLFIAAAPARGAEGADLSARMVRLEEIILRQGKRIAELEDALEKSSSQKISREEIKAALKEMRVDDPGRSAMPGWLEDLKLYGDLRLRYEGTRYSNDDKDRNQGRFRVRVGLTKTWLDKQLEVGMRLASGSTNDPTSTNQTFTGNFSEKDVWIDLAYAKYTPRAVKGLTLVGGKMKNPFVHTDMVWDSDVNPEGVWGEYRYPGWGDFEPFAGIGFFQLVHNNGDHDATLHAYSTGARWKIAKDLKWTSAVTYYDFAHYEDNYTRAGGNTEVANRLTAEEFDVVNLTNKVSWKAFGKAMSAYTDYAHNRGNSSGGKSDAFAIGYKLGKNKTQGDWSAGYKYAYIEADSALGGFNDGTFGRSNRKGHVLSGKYSITDHLNAGVSVYFTQPVSGINTSDTTASVLADLVWKF